MQLHIQLSIALITTADCLQSACLECFIHVFFQLSRNTEKQTQYSCSGGCYLATGDVGQSHVTTEHFSLYEGHPFAGHIF